ncbi:MAG TPA: biliverdin-producing heme oxygenase [Xanthomonadales bacterium]|nr:biliverdin-producing heme oxygenase [Xanthomonadales bacterium]
MQWVVTCSWMPGEYVARQEMRACHQLREATAEAHKSLERTSFAGQLIRGKVEQNQYVDYLRAVAVIIANLTTAIRRDGTKVLKELLPVLGDWSERIGEDIAALAPDDGLANPYAQAATLKHTQKLFRMIADDPAWVYGLLYVIYGSHNGNLVVAQAISREFNLENDKGTTYLRAISFDESIWPMFKARLDRDLESGNSVESAICGARETFETFSQVFDALGSSYQRGVHASAVNPEAGDHPMPRDRKLVRLGNQIGRQVYSQFGYLQIRYGNRGEAFTKSDGAWMITLGDISMERATKLIDWLTRLLSARGIPSFCMEHHLRTLHTALEAENALSREDPDRLLSLADRVGILRRTFISEDEWKAISTAPLPALDPLGSATLLSAAIDQRVGLARCADSLVKWLENESGITREQQVQLISFLKATSSHAG